MLQTDKRARLKRWQIRVSASRQLVITLRRFRTAQHRRSKRVKQFVFRLQILSFREVAIVWQPLKKQRRARLTLLIPNSRTLLPRTLIGIGMIGVVFFGLNLEQPVELRVTARASAATTEVTTQPSTPTALPRSEPKAMRIPKIGLDAALLSTGLGADGSIAVPNIFDAAVWYNGSPTPGELGPAVIIGHVDSPRNIAVFWRLRELAPGDEVQISRADGSTAVFIVTDVKQFPQAEFPTTEIYGNIDHAGLRIITCGGTFDPATQHYSHNTVVYGRLKL